MGLRLPHLGAVGGGWSRAADRALGHPLGPMERGGGAGLVSGPNPRAPGV